MSSAQNASAISISPQQFLNLGGNPFSLTQTLPDVFDKLLGQSNETQFLAVGSLTTDLGQCTATWIGNTPEDPMMYVMTAAHCVDAKMSPDVVSKSITATFKDYSGRVVATGTSAFHSADGRAAERGQKKITASPNDLTVLIMPKVADILDPSGNPISPPALSTSMPAVDQAVSMVGHGDLLVDLLSKTPFDPVSAVHRALGMTMLKNFGQPGTTQGLTLPYSLFSTDQWAKAASGDDGAAIWQQIGDKWSIIGVVSGVQSSGTPFVPLMNQVALVNNFVPQTPNVVPPTPASAPADASAPQGSMLLSPFMAPGTAW